MKVSQEVLLALGIDAQIALLDQERAELIDLKADVLAQTAPVVEKPKIRRKIIKDSGAKSQIHWTQRPENRKRVLAMARKRAKLRRKG